MNGPDRNNSQGVFRHSNPSNLGILGAKTVKPTIYEFKCDKVLYGFDCNYAVDCKLYLLFLVYQVYHAYIPNDR